MISKLNKIGFGFLGKQFYKISFLIAAHCPLLFYLGNRSYIAQDEGYYALQAKWILQTGNWLAPQWWDEVVFDRTLGIQSLIATSQIFFGQTIWAAHIPSIICAIATLIFTYLISEEFTNFNYSWVSPFILSSSFLWVNFSHLATQDIPLLAFELIGIWSVLKINSPRRRQFSFLLGIWIGPAILLKTFMVLIPILLIVFYLLITKIKPSHSFIYGLMVGLIPCLLWLTLSAYHYGFDSVIQLIQKLLYLSKSENYSHSSFYYFWNLPVNFFPWFFFSCIGFLPILKFGSFQAKYFLFIYPTLFFILLSIFNTKTPYYLLQILPLLSITANLGIQNVFSNPLNSHSIAKKIIFSIGIIISIIALYLTRMSDSISLSENINPYIISSVLFLIGIPWILIIRIKSQRNLIIFFILGPYLAYSLLVQSGLFTDRNPGIRNALEDNNLNQIISSNQIDFVFSGTLDNHSFSQVIRLALYMPDLGERLDNVLLLSKGDYAWVSKTNDLDSSFQLISSSDAFRPWRLVKKID